MARGFRGVVAGRERGWRQEDRRRAGLRLRFYFDSGLPRPRRGLPIPHPIDDPKPEAEEEP